MSDTKEFGSNNSCHTLSVYGVPGTEGGTTLVFFHVILTAASRGRVISSKCRQGNRSPRKRQRLA